MVYQKKTKSPQLTVALVEGKSKRQCPVAVSLMKTPVNRTPVLQEDHQHRTQEKEAKVEQLETNPREMVALT